MFSQTGKSLGCNLFLRKYTDGVALKWRKKPHLCMFAAFWKESRTFYIERWLNQGVCAQGLNQDACDIACNDLHNMQWRNWSWVSGCIMLSKRLVLHETVILNSCRDSRPLWFLSLLEETNLKSKWSCLRFACQKWSRLKKFSEPAEGGWN